MTLSGAVSRSLSDRDGQGQQQQHDHGEDGKKLWLLHPAGVPSSAIYRTSLDQLFPLGVAAWADNELIDALGYFQEGANSDDHTGGHKVACLLSARYVLRQCPNLLATPQERDMDRELLQRALSCSTTQQAAAFEDLQLLATMHDGPVRSICLFLQGVIAEHFHHSYSSAIQHYRQAALERYIPAAYNLGLLLVKDESNRSLGYSLIEKAMQKRYPCAIHNCAILYTLAAQQSVNPSPAIDQVSQRFLVASAACGDPESMFALGKCFEHSDLDSAMHYYYGAAYRGHREAQYEVGKAAMSADTPDQNNVENALKYLKLSAAQGHKDACSLLGHLMMQLHMDTTEAQQWITIADSLGEEQHSDGGDAG